MAAAVAQMITAATVDARFVHVRRHGQLDLGRRHRPSTSRSECGPNAAWLRVWLGRESPEPVVTVSDKEADPAGTPTAEVARQDFTFRWPGPDGDRSRGERVALWVC